MKEVNRTLDELFDLRPRIVAVFDRDYRSDAENDEFEENMRSERLLCIVLKRKEIENFALNVRPLVRAIKKRVEQREAEINERDTIALLEAILAKMGDRSRQQTVASYHSYYHGDGVEDADNRANELFDQRWRTLDDRLVTVGGKDFISILSAVLQQQFGCSITVNQIIDEHRRDEVPGRLLDDLNRASVFLT